MTLKNSVIDKNELVFYSEKGNIQSGGYTINNILMNNDIPLMTTNNGNGKRHSDTVGSIFRDLAVPTGLLMLQQPSTTKYPIGNGDNSVIEDSLFNRLLKLASDDEKSNMNNKKHKTKKQRNTKQRKTKKHSIN